MAFARFQRKNNYDKQKAAVEISENQDTILHGKISAGTKILAFSTHGIRSQKNQVKP